MLNGDGGLTDDCVCDKLVKETRKRSFCKMTVHFGNRTENQKLHHIYPCQINGILTLVAYYKDIWLMKGGDKAQFYEGKLI